MSKTTRNFLIGFIVLAAVLISLPFVFYLKAAPWVVSNPAVLTYVQEFVKESLNAELTVKKPCLKTEMKPLVEFKVEEIALSKDKKNLLEVKNFDTQIDFSKVFEKSIFVKKLGADYIFADVNKLIALAPKQTAQAPKSDWNIDLLNSLLYIKKCLIVYQATPDTHIKVQAADLRITASKDPKYVNFKVLVEVFKKDKNIKIGLYDRNKVYIKDHKLFIDDMPFRFNKSRIFLSSVSDENNRFNLNVKASKFDIKDAVELLESNLVVPNGKEMLMFFKNIKGDCDFSVNLSNKGMSGEIKLNKLYLKIIPLNDLAVTANTGKVLITPKEVTLKDFKGYYGKNKINSVDMNGVVKDYMKSVDTTITVNGNATNEFAKNHLSKIAGCPLTLVGDAKTRLIIKSIYNKIDIVWMLKLPKGNDFLVDGASLSPVGYDRAVKGDFHLEGTKLNIKKISYFIAQEINKNSKIKPILTINGNADILKGTVQNLGFDIPKPLPSEFLNVLIGQRVFKKGTIAGHMQVVNTGKYPVLDGQLAMDGVRIPSQRLSIKEGRLKAEKGLVHIDARGKFKRTGYTFKGNILNEIKFPVVVKNIKLTVEDVDVDKLLTSFNKQNTAAVAPAPSASVNGTVEKTLVNAQPEIVSENESDDAYTFDTGLLIVEECILNVVKGVYKDIKFGNLLADLTLDKNGLLQIQSNKFDFAEGISTLKVRCDLVKHQYYVRLGVKDINSDLVAGTLLALKKEISGKAMGLIELNTDDTMKLNGVIKFAVKDGTIQKVGLVEYALKFAALFRNPMANFSPSTIVDLVNVPDGKFKSINGDLAIKDNVLEKIMIKSSSPQLSSFIIGRFDLESRDATLRIYTKFSSRNKGFPGFMRNISLNSLANRVTFGSDNDSNFYATELSQLPVLDTGERDSQVFLTKVDGDVEKFNFLSSLKKIK